VGKLFWGFWPHRYDVYDLDYWNVRIFVEKQCLRDFQICLTDLAYSGTHLPTAPSLLLSPRSQQTLSLESREQCCSQVNSNVVGEKSHTALTP
jgi:hypothetical protein